ncbi:hypothetical protein [Streptomyces sp. NPDC001787]|uniref:hypothetical protein n=1 Tax=Streptomyces sp. NPDC001787 TaxID=3154523 RepID=UPI0033300A33
MESQGRPSTPGDEEVLRQQDRPRDSDSHARIEFEMSDPAVRELRQEVEDQEEHLGTLMSGMYRAQAERWNQALREAGSELLSQICPGKHGRHGRICRLDKGHESGGDPHWGKTAADRPVAWLGSAPDDD